MAAAAILKNRKIAITLQRINRFWRNLAIQCILDLQNPSANKTWKFIKSKMAPVVILKIEKSWYLRNRLTNFDEIWHGYATRPSGHGQPIKFQNF